MTPEQRLALVGIITLIVNQRQAVDALEEQAAKLLESWGATTPERNTALDAVQEWAIEYDRRDTEEIADRIMADLKLEVQDA